MSQWLLERKRKFRKCIKSEFSNSPCVTIATEDQCVFKLFRFFSYKNSDALVSRLSIDSFPFSLFLTHTRTRSLLYSVSTVTFLDRLLVVYSTHYRISNLSVKWNRFHPTISKFPNFHDRVYIISVLLITNNGKENRHTSVILFIQYPRFSFNSIDNKQSKIFEKILWTATWNTTIVFPTITYQLEGNKNLINFSIFPFLRIHNRTFPKSDSFNAVKKRTTCFRGRTMYYILWQWIFFLASRDFFPRKNVLFPKHFTLYFVIARDKELYQATLGSYLLERFRKGVDSPANEK